MRPLSIVAAVTLLLAMAGCATTPATPLPAPATTSVTTTPPVAATGDPAPAGLPRPDHVVVVVFENKAPEQVSGHAPYLDALATRSAQLTNSHGITHPSQPNYFALFSGSTQGVTDDSCVNRFHGRANLRTQLAAAGRTFAAYSEALPSPGYHGCSQDRYAAKHNPWVAFDNVPDSENRQFTAWPADYRTLPTVSFVIPDLCNDMHDCPVATGDQWTHSHLDAYAQWAATHNSLLIVTFDENDGRPGNRILTLIAGAHVRPGRYPVQVTHYGILRTIEGFYGLAPLGHAADEAILSGMWR